MSFYYNNLVRLEYLNIEQQSDIMQNSTMEVKTALTATLSVNYGTVE